MRDKLPDEWEVFPSASVVLRDHVEGAQDDESDFALPGLRGLRAKALHEALEARDLGLLSLDCATERNLARGLLPAPRVPRARRARR